MSVPVSGAEPPGERSLRAQRLLALAVILVPLLALKIWFHPGLGVGTDDGNFYYHLARHVAGGDGLVTSISLYHQDLSPLPQKSTIYPLWPVLLGYGGRAMGLSLASHLIPEVLFFVDLLLLYALFARMESRLAPTHSTFSVAHAAVAVLGTSPIFFRYTSTPFTEALAFLFLLASLLAVDASANRLRSLWPLAAGLLAGLAYLTRYQMVFLGMAIVVAYATLARRNRDAWRAAALSAAGLLAVVMAWWVHLTSIARRLVPALVLDFAAQTRSEGRAMRWVVPADGPGGLLLDRLRGLLVAFSPVGENSYLASFGIAALLVPFAVVLALAGLRAQLGPGWQEGRLTATAVVLSAVLLVAPVHLFHQRLFTEWLFGQRHGLYFAFLIAFAVLWLTNLPQRFVRWATIVVLLIAATTGFLGIATLGSSLWPFPPTNAVRTLAAWLDSRPRTPLVMTTDPQLLSAMTHANFHWIACVDPPEERSDMIRRLHIDYVVVFPRDRERQCGFISGPGGLRVVRRFGSGREEVLLMEPAGR